MGFKSTRAGSAFLGNNRRKPGSISARAHELVVPLFEFRTGPYASAGIPLAAGFPDYLTLLNERDGGINWVRIKIVPCETAYNVQKGVACYEKI